MKNKNTTDICSKKKTNKSKKCQTKIQVKSKKSPKCSKKQIKQIMIYLILGIVALAIIFGIATLIITIVFSTYVDIK